MEEYDTRPKHPRHIPQTLMISLGLDFTTLISTLDNAASEIVAHQRDSTVQRKDLAVKTKEFRKLDDTGKLGEIKGLLKGRYLPNVQWRTETEFY